MSTKVLTGIIGTVFILATLLAVSCGGSAPEPAPAPPPSPPEPAVKPKPMSWDAPPPMIIDTGKKYTALMEMEKGTLVLELFAKDVPKTVNNFVFLSREGFYDGTTFHRVKPGFMAQGGDPTGMGRGGPGYRFEDEFTEHGHVAGALSMANSGSNTNGSQFFITHRATPHLDGKHSVFGRVIEGQDVVDAIEQGDVMEKVTIAEE